MPNPDAPDDLADRLMETFAYLESQLFAVAGDAPVLTACEVRLSAEQVADIYYAAERLYEVDGK